MGWGAGLLVVAGDHRSTGKTQHIRFRSCKNRHGVRYTSSRGARDVPSGSFRRSFAKAMEMPNHQVISGFATFCGATLFRCSPLCALVLALMALAGCQPNGSAKAAKNPKVVVAYPL